MEEGKNNSEPLAPVDEAEGFEHFAFKADPGQEPLRVDKFLMTRIENASRNKIQQAAKSGAIKVNGSAVKPNYKVKPDDLVKVVFSYPSHENLLVPEALPLDIVFEDDDLIVVNKNAGMVVHPGHGNYTGTLINGLLHHFEQLPINSSNRPGLVHRIDKDTSGLLVVAKTDVAMAALAKQFHDKTASRKYTALVWGNVQENEGTVEGHIGRNPKNRLQMMVFPDGSAGKNGITHYSVIERLGYVTLIECRLETGRTHQIRAHMKSIGHTLFNDARYGGGCTAQRNDLYQIQTICSKLFSYFTQTSPARPNIGFPASHPKQVVGL